MSRKFRWFLLAACLFVLVANGRLAIETLAGGPQLSRPVPPAQNSPVAQGRLPRKPPLLPRRSDREGELARGDRRQP
jgi:hypothetical protein